MTGSRDRLHVLVTGGTRGLGLAVVERLLADGFSVTATGRGRSEALDAVIAAHPGQVCYAALDLGRTDAIHEAVGRITERSGPLFGLVNNAALAHDGILATLHDSQIAEMLQVNVLGTILLTKYALRSMLLEKQGRIVNVASIIANTGFNGLAVYGATKAALLGLTRSLAREVGRVGITVNALLPGYMETDMSSGLDESQLATIRKRSPMRTLIETRDAAAAVSFLMSADAARITGTELVVDAGSTA